MCYPAPPDDPGRDRIRVRNTSAVIGNYRAAGTWCVIVNDVVDPALGVQRDLIEHAAVMVCRLRADRGEVVRRLASRDQRGGGTRGDVVALSRAADQATADACALDRSHLDAIRIDIDGHTAGEAADLTAAAAVWPGQGDAP